MYGQQLTGNISPSMVRRHAWAEERRRPALSFPASSMSKVVTTGPDEDAVGPCCASHACAAWDIHLCSKPIVGENVCSSTLRRVCLVPRRHSQSFPRAQVKVEEEEKSGQGGTTCPELLLHGSPPSLSDNVVRGCINSRIPVSTQGALQRGRSCTTGRRWHAVGVLSMVGHSSSCTSKESRQYRGKISRGELST